MSSKGKILNLLKEKILYFDGAMGTQLQIHAPNMSGAPEQIILDDPDTLQKIHESYFSAGCNFATTNTFGGNRLKLSAHGLGTKIKAINQKAVEIAKKAAMKAVAKETFIAGDIGPTGKLLEPFGDTSFETAYECYFEQASLLKEAGADALIIETMSDIQEMRAAIIACKAAAPDLFLIAQMTYDSNHKTLTGTDPVTAAIICEKAGADAIGTNCSTGPDEMIEVARKLAETTSRPVSIQPNAGIPKLQDGKTSYDITPEYFSDKIVEIIKNGASIVGGCCGTSPDFIREIVQKTSSMRPVSLIPDPDKISRTVFLASRSSTVRIGSDYPVRLVAERINPTAQKQIAKELREGRFVELRKEALEQTQAGADLLDVNISEPSIDEPTTMKKAVISIQNIVATPLVIDSPDIKAVEEGLKTYAGRALINSISAKKNLYEKLFPLAKKYGAAFIILPIDEDGIPQTAEKRFEIVKRMVKIAEGYGFSKNDMMADGLVMAVSTSGSYALETLRTIRKVRDELGISTILGVSNISFGLPKRALINSTFLSMSIASGLDSGILNPYSAEIHNVLDTGSVLTGRDRNATRYIAKYAKAEKSETSKTMTGKESPEDKLTSAILQGNKEQIGEHLEQALAANYKPMEIINNILIPAITRVGDFYEEGTYFLPQLIISAETLQEAFKILKPRLSTLETKEKKEKIVFATVKGDVHDIGKKIVVLMMENSGFDVIDLGKDIDAQVIVDTAKKEGAKLIGLSALMTTTMPEMGKVTQLVKTSGLDSTVMVGGAAVNKEFADKIGAHYAKDAVSAGKLAKKLVGK